MLELVVAVGIFATAFLLLLGVFPTATRAIRQANEYLTASYLAEQEIELVRAMDYDAIVAVSPRDVTVQTTNRGITVDTRYTIEVDVSEIDPKNPDQILIDSSQEDPGPGQLDARADSQVGGEHVCRRLLSERRSRLLKCWFT